MVSPTRRSVHSARSVTASFVGLDVRVDSRIGGVNVPSSFRSIPGNSSDRGHSVTRREFDGVEAVERAERARTCAPGPVAGSTRRSRCNGILRGLLQKQPVLINGPPNSSLGAHHPTSITSTVERGRAKGRIDVLGRAFQSSPRRV